MKTYKFPAAVLEQHTAVLGKTGSGKTSTAKLLVEQVVAQDDGSRVCVLDSVKSDWWGLVLDADGKRPGLPFSILGGPRGHVPVHDRAGKAIAELVAHGALRHSIIDMADFGPGGQQHFFVDFAPALLRQNRGVLYLVLEEAHVFAPKERAGFGAENMSIHWAKMLATAGRSKGVRLVVVTQAIQQLHNRVLGGCETLFAHRVVAPADQAPVVAWLKANLAKERAEAVAQSLAKLQTGQAYVVSGETDVPSGVTTFPRIRTFDNSATPMAGDKQHEVALPAIDHQKLRGIIGDAVAEAEASDPAKLKERIRTLEGQVQDLQRKAVVGVTLEQLEEARQAGHEAGYAHGKVEAAQVLREVADAARRSIHVASGQLNVAAGHVDGLADLASKAPPATPPQPVPPPRSAASSGGPREASQRPPAGRGQEMKPMPRAMLTALAQHPNGLTKRQVLIHTGYRSSGTTSGCFAELARNGWADLVGGALVITPAGLKALGAYTPLPVGAALRQHLLTGEQCSPMERAMLGVLFEAYPAAIAKGEILRRTTYSSSGTTSGAFARLVALGYAHMAAPGKLKAAQELFP